DRGADGAPAGRAAALVLHQSDRRTARHAAGQRRRLGLAEAAPAARRRRTGPSGRLSQGGRRGRYGWSGKSGPRAAGAGRSSTPTGLSAAAAGAPAGLASRQKASSSSAASGAGSDGGSEGGAVPTSVSGRSGASGDAT